MAKEKTGTAMGQADDKEHTFEKTGSFRPDEIGEIPRAPGVYLMFDAQGKVIYVGKANVLRARVRQYFALSGGDDRPSVPKIRRNLDHIEIIVTNTEKEAFLLENTLIKRHHPRYNVQLRDDKTYVSVRVDPKEPWPRAVITRERKRDRARYFGPYTNARAIRNTLSMLQRIFPLRSCSDAVLRNRSRPCMLHQIGRCCAPCMGKVPPEEYASYVRDTMLFLKGKTRDLIESLQLQMTELSERMEYEQAAALRDRIAALEQSVESQRVASHDSGDRDAIGYREDRGQAAIAALIYRAGQLVESRNWIVPTHGRSAAETLSQFIGQFYAEGRLIPPEVLLSQPPEEGAEPVDGAEAVEEWLSEMRESRARLLAPQRGDKRRLVLLAEKNAGEILARKLSGRQETQNVLADLARRLHLDAPPRSIECYDIATLQGTMSAGSRVQFVDGEPHKAGYRLYRIKTVEGQDDFAMMREVLQRRFRRAGKKADAKKGDGEKCDSDARPDLVVVDGGKGQLSAAAAALAEIGVEGIALAGLAKSRLKPSDGDEKTRTPERLFLPGRKNPVLFPPNAPSFYLLQRLRDEAHRFVNTYHGKLRRKARLRSSLEDIPGVGARRARDLLRHFGSLTRVRRASVEELRQAPSITAPLAETIHESLSTDGGKKTSNGNEST